jgi:hypothetical protein
MNLRRLLLFAFLVILIVTVAMWVRRSPAVTTPSPKAVPTVVRDSGAPIAAHPSKIAALAAEISPDAISPIAKDLNAPNGSIQHDLEILNDVLVAWQTNFPHEGNPVGENDEITAALAGDNRFHFAFIAPTHAAINAQGQLCDRWGTPFRFHQVSGTEMELRSAGPDRKFGTADDVQFAPARNSP